MNDAVTLDRSDICRHKLKCRCDRWLYHTVPNYRIYVQAYQWLREERKYEHIYAQGEVTAGGYRRYTGRYTFKFLCKQEYNWFVLRWS